MNPIYALYIAAAVGGLLTLYCRPDLGKKILTSAVIFTLLYLAYFWSLIAIAPGYVERVWNLAALSGILIAGVPLEELAFAFSVGILWSSIYEHLAWRRTLPYHDATNYQ